MNLTCDVGTVLIAVYETKYHTLSKLANIPQLALFR